jgi:hypothetical protein
MSGLNMIFVSSALLILPMDALAQIDQQKQINIDNKTTNGAAFMNNQIPFYNNGYNSGYNNGYNPGYNDGYNGGLNSLPGSSSSVGSGR